MKEKSEKSFESKMMDIGRIPNLTAAAITSLYLFYFADLHLLSLGHPKFEILISIILLLVIIAQFGIAPRTNHLITKTLSENLREENLLQTDNKERTILVKLLMKCPIKISIQVFLVFLAIAVLILVIMRVIFKFNSLSLLFFFAGSCYAAYGACILAFSYAERLCSTNAIKIAAMGLDNSLVKKDKFYGLSIKQRAIIFIILPVILGNLVQLFFLFKGYVLETESSKLLINMILIIVLNSIVTIALSIFFYLNVILPNVRINKTLETLIEGKISKHIDISTDLSNEISYNLYEVNQIINYLQYITDSAKKSGSAIIDSTNNLEIISLKSAQTSIEQAASIKECLSTMETIKSKLEQIVKSTQSVSSNAEITTKSISNAVSLLNQNILKISEINDANIDTIAGIKNLSEMIEHIYESIDTIESITEKTRIIAFNAELEATTAGNKGENFHIVANEIRRLTATVTESVTEIKEGIKEIQESSDNLIVSSEGGTQKIREGSELFTSLEENFNELKITSDITSESSLQIYNISKTQEDSFNEINSTLRQISIGFDQFSQSSQLIKKSSEKLSYISKELQAELSDKIETSEGEK